MPNYAAGAVRHILLNARILYHKRSQIARGGQNKKEKPESFSFLFYILFKTGRR